MWLLLKNRIIYIVVISDIMNVYPYSIYHVMFSYLNFTKHLIFILECLGIYEPHVIPKVYSCIGNAQR